MARPARDTLAGQVYNDLRNLARRENRSTDQIMIEYVLERFLYRMSRSFLENSYFILKGGLLLTQFGARRATRDIDILGRFTPHDQDEITSRIAGIARFVAGDGVVFDPSALKTTPIREDSRYGGLRLTMPAAISRAQLKVQLDVSIGDPVIPGPRVIAYPQKLSADFFPVLAYPLPSVVAEKLCTAIALGDLSTRDRDYADLYRILSGNELSGAELAEALAATGAYRGVPIRQLRSVITDLPQRRQASYLAWRRRQGREMAWYPELFADVVALVQAFADPLIAGETVRQYWRPSSGWVLPRRPFRVVASPPYGITAGLLSLLLAPGSRLVAADLVLQRAAVRKYAERRVRGYRITQGAALPRRAFQPAPRVDSAVLVIRRHR
jgi:hypothetical protein